MASIQISLINESTLLTDKELESVLPSLQTQVHRDFAPVWGIDADLTFVPLGGKPNPDSWHLVLLDNSDQADAVGYHDLTDQGLPLGKVFVATDIQAGNQWSVTASHELLEMLADPEINLTVFTQKTQGKVVIYAYEVCDACEPDNFGYLIDNVLVSDFVYPTWFELFHQPGQTKFDHCNHIQKPFEVLAGGYIGIFNVSSGNGWQQAVLEGERLQWKTRAPIGSRRERRNIPRSNWLKNKPVTTARTISSNQNIGIKSINNQIPEPKKRPVLEPITSGQQQKNREWVVCLQNALNGCGLGPLVLDGDFGNKTSTELKKFQENLKLTVNSIAEEKTWSALDQHKKLPYWLYRWPTSLGFIGIPGVDTMGNVTVAKIQEATKLIGSRPRFWGRYFLGRDAEYKRALENKVLHDHGIRVIPVGRETNVINGNYQKGQEIGKIHASDVLATFGEDYLVTQGGVFYIFLDTEPAPQPALSTEYYLGWSKAIIEASSQVRFLPTVYINHGDNRTAQALKTAMTQGAECYGLWVANYARNTTSVSLWKDIQAQPAIDIDCPVLIHQYIGDVKDGIYDFNEINPYLDVPESLVLSRLILPPAS
ncbi:MAG: peptidoglycan-binding domain-containing protein [Nostoc sp.]|uniref:peptidoglycan-binding domain-containing protein n=1 Tax=Nostoc sp. TaxID=1180 RepID=UPI002FF66475